MVLSGSAVALDQLKLQLKNDGIRCRSLRVSHAFHSALMEPILADFEQVARSITYQLPRIPLISNLTGQLADGAIATAQYWVRHIRQPVMFAASMDCLRDQEARIFLEIGPRPTLLAMGRQCFQAQAAQSPASQAPASQAPASQALAAEPTWLASLYPDKDDLPQLLASLASLGQQGVAIDWAGFYGHSDHQRLDQRLGLPTYPFQRQRCWLEGLAKPGLRSRANIAAAPSPKLATGISPDPALAQAVTQPPKRQNPQAIGQYRIVWEELDAPLAPSADQSGGIAARQTESWLILEDGHGVGGRSPPSSRPKATASTECSGARTIGNWGQPNG
ncbi:MAG: acyltransferase domain-containing protein, partial [Synechococcales cyanobacterium RM1_1_8]|nr:acyltransferase domain-containing protein [Synechococcales cyanobacterium RM1_1_8]